VERDHFAVAFLCTGKFRWNYRRHYFPEISKNPVDTGDLQTKNAAK
jgi:hypothetical protein